MFDSARYRLSIFQHDIFFFFSFVALFHHFYLRKGKSCGANAPWKLPLFLQFIAVESKIFMHFFFLFPPILFSDFSSFSAKKNTNCKINVTENSGKGFLGHKEESDSLPMRKCIFSKGVVAKEWIRSFCKKKKKNLLFLHIYMQPNVIIPVHANYSLPFCFSSFSHASRAYSSSTMNNVKT